MAETATGTTRWESLSQWSPIAFIVAGFGLFSVFALGGLELAIYEERFRIIPEWIIAIFGISGFLAIYVGLLGFYPHVSGSSPRLARGGVLTAAISAASLLIAVGGSIVLDFLDVLAFTAAEENPVLLALFFVMIISFFLSLLLYGIASVRTSSPSRLVGLLLLVPVVEPGSVIVIDLFGIEAGAVAPLATLGIAGIAMLAVGYLLRAEPIPGDRAEPAPMEVQYD